MRQVAFLIRIGLIEGASFLLLVGIGMPLKYVWGWPLGVKVFGWIHGVLFILFCWALMRATFAAGWPVGRVLLVLVAALVPFGPFLIDRRMVGYQAEAAKRSGE
jgi:integral membrane protein